MLLLSISTGFSQVSTTYQFSALTGTFTPLTGATNSSLSLTADGGASAAVPIGFTFIYNQISYDQVKMTSDGVLLFGTAGTSTLTNNLATTTATQRPGVAPLWDDLQCTEGVKYQTTGTAPNRVFTAEWLNMEWRYNANAAVISFQVILYESTNVIDFIYRQDAAATNATTSNGASVGIMGSTSTDYISLQDVSASPVISTTTSANGIAVKPATDQVYRWTPMNPAAPDVIQTATVPDCPNGAEVDITGSPATDVSWYWQTTASATSTADPYTGPKFVLQNGYVYARAFNSVLNIWSFASDSVEITNIPVAATPPTPVAVQNPACVTTGTSISVPAAPSGTIYYWQDNDPMGLSTTNDAATAYSITTPGTETFYVRAYESATQCWSDATGITVTVNSFIPLEPAVTTPVNACSGSSSIMLDAETFNATGALFTTSAGGNGCGNGAMFNITTTSIAPVMITSLDVIPNTSTTQNVTVYYVAGGYAGNETTAGAWTLVGTYSITGTAGTPSVVDVDDFMIPASSTYGIYVQYSAQYTNSSSTFSDTYMTITTGAGLCTAFSGPIDGRTFNGTVHYMLPGGSNLYWFDATSGGNQLGMGTTLEAVGTTVLPTATNGTYSFFVASEEGGCLSANTTEVTVNVANVNAAILPIDVNCNNYENGSFALGTIDCGVPPFTYSVDGGAYGPVPTNLAPGTHTVVVRDGNSDDSPTYTFDIIEAEAPSDAVVLAYNNDEVTITWTVNASETSWNIEWGAPGFTPGTGTEIGSMTASNDTISISGLDGNTEYDFYISADCGAGATPGAWAMTNVITLCDPYTIPFAETFEDTSSTIACWLNVQEVGTGNWTFQTGSSGGVVNTAFEGSKNARFVSSSGTNTPITKLVSPILLTQNQDSVAVVFAYAQEVWAGDQNITKVYSRSGTSNAWTEVIEYNTNVNAWTVDTLYVPATNDTVEVAFEGINNFGRANVVDHVQVFPCTLTPGTDGAQDVCRLDGTLDLNTVITQGETWGKWYFPLNQTLITNESMLNVAALPDGTYEFYYVCETPCAVDTTTAVLSIFGPSSAGIDGVLEACMSQPINLLGGLSGNVDLGGTWYGPSGAALTSGYITTGNLAGQFNYNYVTSNGVCPNDSSNVILNILPCNWLGLEDLALEGVTVYPNPTSGMFYISNMENGQQFSFEVLDLNGRKVAGTKEVAGSAVTEVDLSAVENGIYMIRLFNNEGEKMIRIVKQ